MYGREEEKKDIKVPKSIKFFTTFLIVVIVGWIVLSMGLDCVDAQSIGIKDRWGNVQGTMNPGMAWTGFFVKTTPYSMALRKMEVNMLEGEMTSVDIDGQEVKIRAMINYRINTEGVEQAYKTICNRDNGCLEKILNIEGLAREQIKSTTSQYTSKYMWQNRQEVKEEAIKRISDNFPADIFILENAFIPDFKFNPDFVAQLEAQKVYEEQEIAEQKAALVELQLAEKKINFAYGEAEKLKKEADASAYQLKAMAEAQGFEIERIGKAEATALKLKKEQLNDDMLTKEWIDAWKAGGSQVPHWITDGGQQFLVEVTE